MTSLHEKSPGRNRNATDKRAILREQIDESLETLAKAVDAVRASNDFKRYLDIQAPFHNYSWHNTWLIASQRPDATRVAGFRAWQGLGRHVMKGERGIMIFAPCPWKKEKKDGETEAGIFFKVVHVFDLSQTDGKELPDVNCPDVEESADRLLSDLRCVADKRGIAVTFKALEGGAYGVSKKGAIDVDDTRTTGQQAKTLAHELAHEALHWDIKGTFTRSLAELEAESVAYVVCTHFGLDVEVRSSRYIALWDGDSKALRASLERIAKTARGLIDDVEALDSRKAVA